LLELLHDLFRGRNEMFNDEQECEAERVELLLTKSLRNYDPNDPASYTTAISTCPGDHLCPCSVIRIHTSHGISHNSEPWRAAVAAVPPAELVDDHRPVLRTDRPRLAVLQLRQSDESA